MRHLSLGQQLLLFLLALALLAILYFRFYHSPQPTPREETYSEIAIEVVGEVYTPGIYLFRNPPTLKEAIDKAGGVKGAFLQESISLSDLLETGTRVAISIEPSSSVTSGQPNRENPDTIRITLGHMGANKLLVFSIPLDLNRVSVEDLCLVPGIGESLAREIVNYRRSKGGFRSLEELKNVTGIGEQNWKFFQSYFKVEDSYQSPKENGYNGN
jgi:competence protein ComEA